MVKTIVGKTDEVAEDVDSLKGMSKEDFINNANNSLEDEEASDFWKMIGTGDAENIFTSLDSDGDGTLSEEELNILAGADGDDSNISLKDLGEFFKAKEAEEAIGAEAAEESESPEAQAETPETVQPQTQTDSSGASAGNYNGDGNTNYNPDIQSVQEDARTPEKIQQEITEQENK